MPFKLSILCTVLIFGPFWAIFGPIWQFWVIFGYFGSFWVIFGPFFGAIFLAKNVSVLFLLLFASLPDQQAMTLHWVHLATECKLRLENNSVASCLSSLILIWMHLYLIFQKSRTYESLLKIPWKKISKVNSSLTDSLLRSTRGTSLASDCLTPECQDRWWYYSIWDDRIVSYHRLLEYILFFYYCEITFTFFSPAWEAAPSPHRQFQALLRQTIMFLPFQMVLY